MSFFRRLPVIVEARELTTANGKEIAEWCGGTWMPPALGAPGVLLVPTLEGDLLAYPGTRVVKGPEAEFWPVRADIFAKTYEPAEDGAQS